MKGRTHSRLYYEMKNKISAKRTYNPSEAFALLVSLNEGSASKTLNVSVTLRKVKQKFNFTPVDFALPFPLIKNKEVYLLSDYYHDSLLESYLSLENVSVITFRDFLKKTEENDNFKFGLLIAHPNLENELKTLKKNIIALDNFPTKKNGFLTEDISLALKKYFSGVKKIKFDKNNNLHFVLGSTKFPITNLEINYKNFYNKIVSLRPSN